MRFSRGHPSKNTMRKILFCQYLAVEVVNECILVIVADGQRHVSFHQHVILLYLTDFVKVDDERTVDAHKLVGGQVLFDLLHAQQHDNGLVFTLTRDPQVLAHGLDVADLLDVDANNFVVALDVDNAIVTNLGGHLVLGLLADFADVSHLLGGGFKLVKTVGLQQVAHTIGFVTLDGILAIGGGEYQDWPPAVVLLY